MKYWNIDLFNVHWRYQKLKVQVSLVYRWLILSQSILVLFTTESTVQTIDTSIHSPAQFGQMSLLKSHFFAESTWIYSYSTSAHWPSIFWTLSLKLIASKFSSSSRRRNESCESSANIIFWKPSWYSFRIVYLSIFTSWLWFMSYCSSRISFTDSMYLFSAVKLSFVFFFLINGSKFKCFCFFICFSTYRLA